MTSTWTSSLHSSLYSFPAIFFSALVVDPGGCSGGNVAVGIDDSPAPDASGPESGPPANEPGPNDGGPVGPPVWNAQSTGFELDISGGYTPAPEADICFPGFAQKYRYDATSRLLTLTGCDSGLPLADSAQLSSASASTLVARLAALMSVGPTSGCGADAPDTVLTVFDAGGAAHRYPSTFYSGCGPSVHGVTTGPGPYVPDQALTDLDRELSAFLDACQDGGSAIAAGATCVALPADAGAASPD